MLRYYFDIIISLPHIIYYILKIRYIMRHQERYSEEYRYKVACNMVNIVMRHGRIKTDYSGTENLPSEGGYLMYANHQGRFDSLGIIYGHDKPCSIVIDEIRSRMTLVTEFTDVLDGIRLDKSDMKKQVKSIRTLAERVAAGKRYIIFPEGGHNHNQNTLQEFLPGAFKAALWSKVPIVPVALIDSYVPFEINSLRTVTTKVRILRPLYYDDYKDMNTNEIADLVKKMIGDAISVETGSKAFE